jgi:hypothetical protein
MRISKLIFVGVCLVGLTQLGWSQAQHLGASKQAHGVPGYLDPRTGTFTTRAQGAGETQDASQEPTALTNIVARLVFNISIVYNDQPAGAITACSVDISEFGDPSGLFYTEDATAIATSNGTVCKVTILFDWALATPTSDQISIDYHIESIQPVTVGGTTLPEVFRTLDHSIPSVAVPMNGQTITEPTIYTYM